MHKFLQGPASAVDSFFQRNTFIFYILLAGSLFTGLVLFGYCLVHSWRGTRYPFVIGLTIAVLVDLLCYSAFCLAMFTEQPFRVWYFLAVAIFVASHWVIASTYFVCASELPCVMAKTIPSNFRRNCHRVFFVAILAFGIVSSSWTLESEPSTYKSTLLGVNMGIMVLISGSMVVALQRIRSCLIKSGFKDRLSNFKLTLHALAFLLYIGVLIVSMFIDREFYFHWLVALIFGDGAFVCLFLMLYHLGTKQKAPQVSTTRETSSTTFKDFSYQEHHEDDNKGALIFVAPTSHHSSLDTRNHANKS